jgi:hypothetical protein
MNLGMNTRCSEYSSCSDAYQNGRCWQKASVAVQCDQHCVRDLVTAACHTDHTMVRGHRRGHMTWHHLNSELARWTSNHVECCRSRSCRSAHAHSLTHTIVQKMHTHIISSAHILILRLRRELGGVHSHILMLQLTYMKLTFSFLLVVVHSFSYIQPIPRLQHRMLWLMQNKLEREREREHAVVST